VRIEGRATRKNFSVAEVVNGYDNMLLDLLGIQSTVKRRELAIFADCRANAG
jgi:hypothetical protein